MGGGGKVYNRVENGRISWSRLVSANIKRISLFDGSSIL